MGALGTLINPHELAITSMHQIGGGGGNRLVSRGSRYIARPLGQRQAMLDETLSSPRVDAR